MLYVVLSTTYKCLDMFFVEQDFCLLFFSPLAVIALLHSEYLTKTSYGGGVLVFDSRFQSVQSITVVTPWPRNSHCDQPGSKVWKEPTSDKMIPKVCFQ